MYVYGRIEKVDHAADGTIHVFGVASTESVDDQGEIVLADAMRAAIPGYMQFPALRSMHQLDAAGTTLTAEVGEDGLTRIEAHVVDPIAALKVKNNVFRGFSIGGRVTKRDADNPKIITGIQLNEISLVDRPANPEAVMECWKASLNDIEGSDMKPGLATIGDTPAGEKLAALNPIQIWACDHAEHRHVGKAEAVQCLEADTAAKAADAAEASDETSEAAETSEGGSGEDREDVGKAAVVDAGEPGGAESARAAADAATIERRTQEGVNEVQATIDAALKAVERGDIVLAETKVEEEGVAEDEPTAKAAEGNVPCVPGVSEDSTEIALKPPVEKTHFEVADIGIAIGTLCNVAKQMRKEAAAEGDEFDTPAKIDAVTAMLCSLAQDILDEEAAEIADGSEVDEDALILLSAKVDTLRKAGLDAAAEKLAATVEKAGAKHSARDQMLLDAAYTCCAKATGMDGCTKAVKQSFDDAKECVGAAGGKGFEEMASKSSDTLGFTMAIDGLAKGGGHTALADMAHDAISRVTKAAACSMGKAGARHSKETLVQLGKAHGYLCAAGATCDGVKKDDSGDDVGMASASADLGKALEAERADKAAVVAENAALVKALGEIVPMLNRVLQRVEDIAQAPLPAQAVARVPGTSAVSKTQDGRDPDNNTPLFTAEEIIKALPVEERPMAAMRLAHKQPMDFSSRFRSGA